jgi:hypothetical protein
MIEEYNDLAIAHAENDSRIHPRMKNRRFLHSKLLSTIDGGIPFTRFVSLPIRGTYLKSNMVSSFSPY